MYIVINYNTTCFLENIEVESKHFQKTSVRVKRKEQCKHCKVRDNSYQIYIFVILCVRVALASLGWNCCHHTSGHSLDSR